MSNAITIKQGKPSAPGTVVDTSAAKVVPTSSEVQAESKKRGGTPDLKAALETGVLENAVKKPAAAKKPAAKKGSAKAKPAAAKPQGGGTSGPNRLTSEWASAKKKDVAVKDEVTVNGVVIKIIGRWTKRKGDVLVPMVTGRIVSGAPDGKKKGDRHNAVAAEVTHVATK
jgi:hypothetical protein